LNPLTDKQEYTVHRTVFLALSLSSLMALGPVARAQGSSAEPQQVLTLTATARQEVSQDWLTVVTRAQLDGKDPAAVQTQLNAIVQAALASLRPQQRPQQLEVRSGNLGIYPRHDAQGRLTTWQGQAELVIEGRDFAQVSQLAAGLARMNVAQATFSLSRDGRQQLETQVQSQAVQNFRQRAQALALDFGFAGYSLRQVSVSSVDRPEPVMQPRMLMAEPAAASTAAAPLALAAGKEEVRITVSGSIVLR
jgi:predicted secreted protein